jgi:hypothetical protein
MRTQFLYLLAAGAMLGATVQNSAAQANLPLFTDNLVNGFQNWSWATVNLTNSSPVHSGTRSISVYNAGNYQALWLEQPNFNTAPYASLNFWANGGTNGGQTVTVKGVINGNGVGGFSIGPLTAGTWTQYTIPLSSLGIANVTNCNGIQIQGTSGAQQVFYVDDMQLVAAPAPTVVHLKVDASKTLRTVDSRCFGVNNATWDGYLNNSQTLPLLRQNGVTTLRWPGGSTSDGYHWYNDTANNNTFNQLATNLGANVFITVNYGSGTSNEAAAWVKSVNVTNNFGFKYWEIGNECYGTWETDNNAPAHDPYTYAARAAGYIQLMRAASPGIHIGVVAVPGENTYSNNANHFAINPRTGSTNYGWTPIMLNTLKTLGVTPDFLIYHFYPEYTPPTTSGTAPANDSDALLMQVASNPSASNWSDWASAAASLRQQLTDYLGASNGSNVELVCTENNSDSGGFGKQLTSIVNGLYVADSLAALMKTEFNGYIWWDFRNGAQTTGSFDPTLYGWRTVGDEGMVGGASSPPYPTFYAEKLMQFFARGGDTVLNASSDYLLLSAYAVRRTNGALALLVINKDVTTNFTAQISLTNFFPAGSAMVRSFGINQDEAARTNNPTPGSQDIATNSLAVSALFTNTFPAGSMTLITFSSGLIASTVNLISGANPSVYGNPVSFTATVQTNGVAVGNISGESVTFYNGAVTLGSGNLNGSGQASYSTTSTQLPAGNASVTAVYGGNTNYVGSSNSPALAQTVNTATVTAGLTGTVAKNYDGTTAATLAAGNYSLAGVVGGDSVTLNNPAAVSYDSRNAGSGKTVTVNGLAISGSSATNYTLSSATVAAGVGVINPTNLTVTAAANVKNYDGTTAAATLPVVTVGSVQAGDNGSFAETYDTQNVGTGKTLTPSGAVLDGNAGNNYNYTFVPAANGTINPATLTYTANPTNMVYGSAVPGLGGTVGGFVTGENQSGATTGTMSFTTTATSTSGVGSYAVNGSGLTANNGNYNFVQAAANATALSVTAASLTVTNLAVPDKVYDGTTNAPLDASNAGLNGILNSDQVTLSSSNAAGYYMDKNVGTNKPVTVIGLALAGTGAANYVVLAPTNLTGNITFASLTVTGIVANSKLFDGTTLATVSGPANLNGMATGDNVSLVTSNETATFADPNVGIGIPVTVTGYATSGADAANYNLSQPTGLTANILAAAPAISSVSASGGVVQIQFTGPAGAGYSVLAGSDLTVPLGQWSVVATGTFGAGPVTVSDNSSSLPRRFYVIVSQ